MWILQAPLVKKKRKGSPAPDTHVPGPSYQVGDASHGVSVDTVSEY